MKIDLDHELKEQLDRLRSLAIDAENSETDPLSQRATALTAMSNLLRELVKNQAEVINMSRLQVLEQTIIDLLNEFLTTEQTQEFILEYETRLAALEQREFSEE